MRLDSSKLTTHIPYIRGNRIPYWCFGEFNIYKRRCKLCVVKKECEGERFDLIEWHPIIGRVSKKL